MSLLRLAKGNFCASSTRGEEASVQSTTSICRIQLLDFVAVKEVNKECALQITNMDYDRVPKAYVKV